MEHQTGPDRNGQQEHDTAGSQPGRLAADAAEPDVTASGDDLAAGAGEQPSAAPVASKAVPATGEPRVDAALRLLDRLPGLPVSDHPELFEQVHAQLSEVLGELDSGTAAGRGPAGA
jgi:hypothetical protein